MLSSPTIIPAKRRLHHRRKPSVATAAPAALVLVSATYVESTWIELTFDRAIDIAGIVGSAFLVYDGNTETFYSGAGGAELLSATTVRVALVYESDWFEPGVVMSANASNGIVASGDESTWAGVNNVELPFP